MSPIRWLHVASVVLFFSPSGTSWKRVDQPSRQVHDRVECVARKNRTTNSQVPQHFCATVVYNGGHVAAVSSEVHVKHPYST